jgi:hypothetical protein
MSYKKTIKKRGEPKKSKLDIHHTPTNKEIVEDKLKIINEGRQGKTFKLIQVQPGMWKEVEVLG